MKDEFTFRREHLVELMKWGNVCWVGARNVCLVGVIASAVALDGGK
jgi:hypothetical protein